MIKIVLAITKALAGLKEKSITGVNVKSLTQAIFFFKQAVKCYRKNQRCNTVALSFFVKVRPKDKSQATDKKSSIRILQN